MYSQDRRKYRRVGCRLPSAMRGIAGAGVEPAKTVVSDISEGGLRFSTQTPVPLTGEFYVSLAMASRTVFAKAKAVWMNRLANLNCYEVGACFLDILPDDRNFIRQYVASRL